MKQFGVFLLALLGVTQAQAAELTTFQAGDPIYASELNGNFQELEARINALTANVSHSEQGLAGEPFNYFLPDNGAGGYFTLETGYDYYITDAIWPLGVMSESSCNGALIAKVRTAAQIILEVPARGGGATCGHIGDAVSLQTPIVIKNGEPVGAVDSRSRGVRIIGYRVPISTP
ncbi:hypothetical protein [Alcanivorax sediminis]|uniref:Uncharacterized protein n=1 Tax=Alcanivorax sediminis TaxID=2663008 RepID=A0A6N7LTW6_9GAMM|nr:hypothetical protein [Alcanivorax sediminis]MQX53918.1 hypothetical protein [Alcanivorax sediminis]